ncbi:hypothetical protein LTR22_026981 [Elasticomyces elasticus]|nr:hypothetical protein LTR22_026981 [Elasticomyces elasticus]
MNSFEVHTLGGTHAKPPFLFRSASDQSRGINNANRIDPLAAYPVSYHENVAAIPREGARSMLRSHSSWDYGEASEFSSWSVSLLWVLVHAVRKAQGRGETGIRVYVLCTSEIHYYRVHRAKDLVSHFQMQDIPYIEEYCKYEYLVHGIVARSDGFWSTTLDALSNAGLYEQFPELHNPDYYKYLYIGSEKLRSRYFDNKASFDIDSAAVSRLTRLGYCFSDPIAAIMSMAFASVQSRDMSLESLRALLEAVKKMSISKYLEEACNPFLAYRDDSDSFAESRQSKIMLQYLRGEDFAKVVEVLERQPSTKVQPITSTQNDLSRLFGTMTSMHSVQIKGQAISADLRSVNEIDGTRTIHRSFDPAEGCRAEVFHNDYADQDSWLSDDEHEELVHEHDIGEWNTDDEVEEAHISDDMIRQLEGDW